MNNVPNNFTFRTDRSTDLPVPLDDIKKQLGISGYRDDKRIEDLTWAAIDWLENRYSLVIANSSWEQTVPSLRPEHWRSLTGYLGFPFGFGWYPHRGNAMQLLSYPVISFDSVGYYDADGNVQDYDLDNFYFMQDMRYSSYVEVKQGVEIPATQHRPDAWSLFYSCGYGEITSQAGGTVTTALPAGIVQAIKVVVGEFNENREGSVIGSIVSPVQMGIDRLIGPYVLDVWGA